MNVRGECVKSDNRKEEQKKKQKKKKNGREERERELTTKKAKKEHGEASKNGNRFTREKSERRERERERLTTGNKSKKVTLLPASHVHVCVSVCVKGHAGRSAECNRTRSRDEVERKRRDDGTVSD